MTGQDYPSTSSSSLVEALVSGDREGLGGILCNDASGLCLAARGAGLDAGESAGTYTSLVRLAAQLHPSRSAADGGAGAAPLITIETDDSVVLCKEYHGHAVAVRVPLANKDAALSEATDAAAP